jgi:putative acetyltransferase
MSGEAGDNSLPRSVEVADVRVVDFEPRWRDDFARLNIEWLERWFTVEPVDREVLGEPENYILASGGRILFAVDDTGHALGTVALLRHEDGLVELTKMAVEPELRGAGIGRKLMSGALDAFAQMGGHELFLETNTRLAPAIKLYESVGFRRRPTVRPGSHYQRADVYMVWEPDATDLIRR